MNQQALQTGKRRTAGPYTVWVSAAERIASFHPVEGYAAQTFATHEFFLGYLHSLQERSFRFQ